MEHGPGRTGPSGSTALGRAFGEAQVCRITPSMRRGSGGRSSPGGAAAPGPHIRTIAPRPKEPGGAVLEVGLVRHLASNTLPRSQAPRYSRGAVSGSACSASFPPRERSSTVLAGLEARSHPLRSAGQKPEACLGPFGARPSPRGLWPWCRVCLLCSRTFPPRALAQAPGSSPEGARSLDARFNLVFSL